MPAPAPCPACGNTMEKRRFARRPEGEVLLDLCFHCQGIWFDEFESARLAPSGILALFRDIGEHRNAEHAPWPGRLHCPRCSDPLMQGYDLGKHGKFSYHRCLQKHGRFTAFSAFMIEKGFVRQLSGAEIAELAKQVQTVRCSGCGAPVDIRRDPVCNHCRAPIVVLDPQAVVNAMDNYTRASEREGMIDVNAFSDALLMQEKQKYQTQRERYARKSLLSGEETNIVDLVASGIELIGKLLPD